MDYSVIDNWLANASLPAHLPRRLTKDGLWKINVAGTSLLMMADTEAEELFFSASLYALSGEEPAAFYAAVLGLHLSPILPDGTALTIDPRNGKLVLFARMNLRYFSAERFNEVLTGIIASLPSLVDRIAEVYEEAEDEARTNTAPVRPAAPQTTAKPASDINVDDMSDEDFLRMQLMQSISI